MMYFHTLERVLDPVHPLLVLPRGSPLHSRYPRSLPAVIQEPEDLLSFEIVFLQGEKMRILITIIIFPVHKL